MVTEYTQNMKYKSLHLNVYLIDFQNLYSEH